MIFERLDRGILSLEIDKLQEHVRDHVLPLSPTMTGQFFGGWSVWSSNGDYRDGFHSGEKAYDSQFQPGKSVAEKAASIGNLRSNAYRVPTEICFGYLAEVMSLICTAGFEPARPRLSLLKAEGWSKKHRDGPDDAYMVRLHIPVFTNSLATFQCDDGEAHMPADGSAYLLRVNRDHQVFNRGKDDRIVLIMNVTDRQWRSQYHRFP